MKGSKKGANDRQIILVEHGIIVRKRLSGGRVEVLLMRFGFHWRPNRHSADPFDYMSCQNQKKKKPRRRKNEKLVNINESFWRNRASTNCLQIPRRASTVATVNTSFISTFITLDRILWADQTIKTRSQHRPNHKALPAGEYVIYKDKSHTPGNIEIGC
jgi:hypothetical protein